MPPASAQPTSYERGQRATCIVSGDAARDIEAWRNAEVLTLAVLFGYLSDDDRPHEWGADG